ncbi:MAG: ABC transporter ATP-binding protein [Actinobacteria bacterium]|nr:ABC transporter ATP-binding protein [Actinomycetota bacterium]MBW3650548.1 ABC transporter ATP-binding protein [Actinomycetota bacterium]
MVPIVRAEAVGKRWGTTQALSGATFEIGPGITGLLGANGAGKTTLLGLVLGMHRPDQGRLEVLGRDPWRLGPQVRARLGYAPEHEALPGDVRAHDVVRHFAEVHGLAAREAQTRASDALWEVGLGEERFRPVGTMSTGQRQRVKLAVAIAHDPEVVLLDEPTNGLDPVQREHMLGLVRRVAHDLGLNVILSSHLLEEVERVSDAVLILDAGRVVRSGPLGELRGGDRPELLVEVDAGAPAAERLVGELARHGVSGVAAGASVVVSLDSDAVYDVVRDALVDLSLGVRRIERRRASLEDVFLAAGEGGA